MGQDWLAHHGIIGQKWGIRRFQNLDGTLTAAGRERYGTEARLRAAQNLKGARTSNLDKWGKDPQHNALYITGYSGSGKSTTAFSLQRPGDTVVHLDGYVEPGDHRDIQDKRFNAYLNKEVPKWRDMKQASTDQSGLKRFSKEYWDVVDSFTRAIESYSAAEFYKNHRVIVEGVQIADDWWGNPDQFKGKPMIVLGSNAIKSYSRAFQRDSSGIKSVQDARNYVNWIINMNKNLNRLTRVTGSRKGQQFVNDLLKRV